MYPRPYIRVLVESCSLSGFWPAVGICTRTSTTLSPQLQYSYSPVKTLAWRYLRILDRLVVHPKETKRPAPHTSHDLMTAQDIASRSPVVLPPVARYVRVRTR